MGPLMTLALLPLGLWALSSLFDGDDADDGEPVDPVDPTDPTDPEVIEGGEGDDTIAVSGSDTVTTGAGADVIQLGSAHSEDLDSSVRDEYDTTPLALVSHVTVTDFTPGLDRIEIDATAVQKTIWHEAISYDRASYTPYDIELREEDGNTIIAFGQTGGRFSDAMVLEGVTGLSKDDIVLTLPDNVAGGDDRGDGSATADLMLGTGGADSLMGALGDDTLSGLLNVGGVLTDDGHADTLSGGWDRDVLMGNGGDRMEGGKGDDVIVHVADADTEDAPGAVILAGEGHDIVYASGADTVDLGASSGEANSLVLADPRLCSTEDLLNTHLVVQNFGNTPDVEFGNAVFAELVRDQVVIDPVTGAQTVRTITLTPHLREDGGNTILSLTNDASGEVYDNIITFEGVTGLTVDEVISPPNDLRPLRMPELVGASV